MKSNQDNNRTSIFNERNSLVTNLLDVIQEEYVDFSPTVEK